MNPLLNHTLLKKWVLWLSVPLSLMLLPASHASDFRQPENITANDAPGGVPHMSQNSSGQLLWDGGDSLLLAYWDGNGSVSAENPSRVMMRQWTAPDGWGAGERVDRGVTGQGEDVGGRHPTMIRRADGSVLTVWHDMRHCSEDLNWINNVEIYGNVRIEGGGFQADQRLTQTISESNGDNGFVPRLARFNDGRLVLVWYDFHYTMSEIFLSVSDSAGNFSTASDLAPLRLTGANGRPAIAEGENFVTPSVAVDGNDIIHLAWTSIDSSVGATPTFKLYYGRYNPAYSEWLDIMLYRTDTGGYYDPARLITDPTTGGVWMLYVDRATNGNDEIYAEYRPAGAAFGERVRLTEDSAQQHYPDGVVDADGVLHVVYVDEAGDNSIKSVTYDRATQALGAPEALSSEDMGKLYRPAVTQDESGSLYVVWESKLGFDDYDLWFTTNRPPENAARDWMLYR